MVTVKVVREDKKEFLIDDVSWRIPSDGLEGWDTTEFSVTTDNKSYGDGSYYVSERVPEKDRTVEAIFQNKHLNETMRQLTRSFFNPKHKYKVYLTYQNITRWCEGKLIALSIPTKNINKLLKLKFTILCEQPFLLSVDDFSKNIADVIPRFGFPYISKIDTGFIFSEFEFAKETYVENDGDVETFMKVVIKSKGYVKNPVIKKDDKFIKLIDTLKSGDIVVIDLVSRPARITKNDEKIMRLLDRGSSFNDIKIGVGKNKISFDADDGNNNMDVVIYFNKRYTGI